MSLGQTQASNALYVTLAGVRVGVSVRVGWVGFDSSPVAKTSGTPKKLRREVKEGAGAEKLDLALVHLPCPQRKGL